MLDHVSITVSDIAAAEPLYGNGLLRYFEPFRPYRQGSSTALVMPIRKPVTISGVCGRA
jgi:hypothetical protein